MARSQSKGLAYPEAALHFAEKKVEKVPEFNDGDEGCYIERASPALVVSFARKLGFNTVKVAPGIDWYEAAVRWLNKYAPTGFYFGINEGGEDFGLWRNDEVWGDLEAEFLAAAG
jgi:hypothetical protein